MCGFFRTAVFLVFVAEQDLLDPKIIVGKKGGFENMKTVFSGYFDVELIEFNKMSKNIGRFKETNSKWGRDASKVKRKYYETFSPSNWIKLDDSVKIKHNVFCEECSKSFHGLQAEFPSNPIKFTKEMKENLNTSVLIK